MYIFHIGLISGFMVGLEVKFLEEDMPYLFSFVVDLLIIRIVFQKLKHVR
jgi:hypothetical protein